MRYSVKSIESVLVAAVAGLALMVCVGLGIDCANDRRELAETDVGIA